VSIVIIFLAGAAMLARLGEIDLSVAKACIGGGLLVASVGFIDDHTSVSVTWRLLAHFVAAAWVVYSLGGLPPVPFLAGPVDLGRGGDILAVVALVWLLNLYNFMDGIDGIAGIELVTACLGIELLYALHAVDARERLLPGLLAMSTCGFLCWNFPPARIFLGDAGSGFLGLMLGTLTLRDAAIVHVWVWSWVILLGVFIVDATITLLMRLLQRQKLHHAHRGHAYQAAALRIGSHRAVIVAVSAINILWLLPIALLVGAGEINGLIGAIIAYAPLTWLAIRLGPRWSKN
jgi:Fuc2NAc and GlcNAc transferase